MEILMREKWMEERRKEIKKSGMCFKQTDDYLITLTTEHRRMYSYEWENDLYRYLKKNQVEEKELFVYSFYKNEGNKPIKRYFISYFMSNVMIQMKIKIELRREELIIAGFLKHQKNEYETEIERYVDLIPKKEKEYLQNIAESLSAYFSKIEPNFRVRIMTGKMKFIYHYSIQKILNSLANEDN